MIATSDLPESRNTQACTKNDRRRNINEPFKRFAYGEGTVSPLLPLL